MCIDSDIHLDRALPAVPDAPVENDSGNVTGQGSVIKFGNIISVTAKVIDVETAKIIDSADAKVKDVDAISTEIDLLAWELAID